MYHAALRLPGTSPAPLVGAYEGYQNSKTKDEKSHPEKLFLLFLLSEDDPSNILGFAISNIQFVNYTN